MSIKISSWYTGARNEPMEAGEYRRLYELEDELWWFRGMARISMSLLERHLPAERRGAGFRILDAGCGTGGMLPSLSELGTVFGLDSSSAALGFALRRSAAPLVRGSVSELPFKSASFDLVTTFDVLYHLNVRDDEQALSELARVVRPEGTVLLRVPACDRLRGRHDEAVHTRQRYGKKELAEKLRRAGLEPVYVSFANCLLFPLALARRGAERLRRSGRAGSEVEALPAVLNGILLAALRLEARLVRRTSLPFGLSLVAVARKS